MRLPPDAPPCISPASLCVPVRFAKSSFRSFLYSFSHAFYYPSVPSSIPLRIPGVIGTFPRNFSLYFPACPPVLPGKRSTLTGTQSWANTQTPCAASSPPPPPFPIFPRSLLVPCRFVSSCVIMSVPSAFSHTFPCVHLLFPLSSLASAFCLSFHRSILMRFQCVP